MESLRDGHLFLCLFVRLFLFLSPETLRPRNGSRKGCPTYFFPFREKFPRKSYASGGRLPAVFINTTLLSEMHIEVFAPGNSDASFLLHSKVLSDTLFARGVL